VLVIAIVGFLRKVIAREIVVFSKRWQLKFEKIESCLGVGSLLEIHAGP